MIQGHISPCETRALGVLSVCGGVGGGGNIWTHLLSFLVISSASWLAAVIDASMVSAWGGGREQSIKSPGGQGGGLTT